MTLPAGAAPLRATSQVEVSEMPRVAGLQDRAVTATGAVGMAGTLMVPPLGESGRESPAGDASRAFVTLIGAVVTLGVNAIDTTPTTPLEIVLA